MSLFDRIANLVSANVNHLLEKAEDPEVMVKQIIRDMEGSIIELRRETVRAVTREKQLRKQVGSAGELVGELEEQAKAALKENDEDRARTVLAKKIHTTSTKVSLEKDLVSATEAAERLKTDLARLEDQAQAARRKKEELIRRKRQAEEELRSQEATKRTAERIASADDLMEDLASEAEGFDTLEDTLRTIEARAEAEREILGLEIQKELDMQTMVEENAIHDELERLKKEL